MSYQRKVLLELAQKMQVLKPAEKNKYLYELDRYIEDCRIRSAYKQCLDDAFPHYWAKKVYLSLEGTSYEHPQPRSFSQTTLRDVKAREEFGLCFKGVSAYKQATCKEREAFKQVVLKSATPFKKIVHFIRVCQNRMA